MNDRKEKLPAILFYPGDWNSDPQLKLCSLAAQGFWMRLLCVMHTCVPYGHLTFRDNLPASNKETAQVTGVHTNGVSPLVTELERHGVLSRTPGGVIYSRRMVRDYEKRLINKQNGEKGGNPFFKISVNPSVKPPVKAGVKAISIAVSNNNPPVSPPSKPSAKNDTEETWRPSIGMFLETYNRHCPGLVQAKEPTDERIRLFRKHWERHPQMEYWTKVMVIANGSSFAKGDNDRAKVGAPALGRYVDHRPAEADLPDTEFLKAHSMKKALAPAGGS